MAQHVHSDPAASRQPAEVTTGVVWSETLAQTTAPALMVNRTHFTPGARTCWHRHPRGQVLVVESGVALVQEEGGPVLRLRAGQSVECGPGVEHWHGAGPDHTFTQLAVTPRDEQGAYAVVGRARQRPGVRRGVAVSNPAGARAR